MAYDTQTVLVTGAGRGIGKATAEQFAEDGSDVVVLDIDGDAAEHAVDELPGTGHRAVEADVTDQADVEAAIDLCRAEMDGLSVLVNNAGIAQEPKPTVEQDLSEWENIMDVHVKGMFLCSKFAAPLLLESEGCIVNISSIAGLRAFPYRTAYSTAKSAISMLTKVLAVEWAQDNLRVNAVAPGYVRTEMVEDFIERGDFDYNEITGRTPMGRLANPSDIADAIGFLASDDAAYITGVTLPVDGGWDAYGHT
jgi:NAD(P)-dependent dehydrogenase (short-subunit alcohol dehydrogenase family)